MRDETEIRGQLARCYAEAAKPFANTRKAAEIISTLEWVLTEEAKL